MSEEIKKVMPKPNTEKRSSNSSRGVIPTRDSAPKTPTESKKNNEK